MNARQFFQCFAALAVAAAGLAVPSAAAHATAPGNSSAGAAELLVHTASAIAPASTPLLATKDR